MSLMDYLLSGFIIRCWVDLVINRNAVAGSHECSHYFEIADENFVLLLLF